MLTNVCLEKTHRIPRKAQVTFAKVPPQFPYLIKLRRSNRISLKFSKWAPPRVLRCANPHKLRVERC